MQVHIRRTSSRDQELWRQPFHDYHRARLTKTSQERKWPRGRTEFIVWEVTITSREKNGRGERIEGSSTEQEAPAHRSSGPSPVEYQPVVTSSQTCRVAALTHEHRQSMHALLAFVHPGPRAGESPPLFLHQSLTSLRLRLVSG